MLIAFALILSLIIVWYLLSPHFILRTGASETLIEESQRSLIDSKERSLQLLKDLELDYSTNKLSDADYVRMKRDLSLDLARIIKQLDNVAS